MSPSDADDLAERLAAGLDAKALESLPDALLQRLLVDATGIYARRQEEGPGFLPFPADPQVTATEVMVTVTAMLKAVNLQLFELGMWQAWSGNT